MSIHTNRDGTVTFVSDDGQGRTQDEPAGLTSAQIATAYATFQATWLLSWWQATQQAANYSYMSNFVNWPQFFDGGTLTNVTGANVGNFIAAALVNYRTKKEAIAAATTSAQVIAIDVTSGYPANP